MVIRDLPAYGASEKLTQALASTGLKELYPPQVTALKKGLLSTTDSFVVSAPTASGKTLIAEMAFLREIFGKAGKVLYLVPLRALAREKYEDFSKKYRDLGIKVGQSTGDYDSTDPWLSSADMIISTNEKMDSLIRHRASWLKQVRIVIADEIHLIGDPHRGPTLEIVLSRLRWTNPEIRIIALSATIPNSGDISKWLGAKLVESDWRPVPLREGVFFHSAVIFNNGTVKWITEDSILDVINLSLDTIREKGQALVFVNTRKSTEALAQKACSHIAKTLLETERKSLENISGAVLAASPEPTRLCRKLAECVGDGVAFHHAGITSAQRKIVEDAFRANEIKLVVATTTLAMGLNLPSRRVIIRDWWRYEAGAGMHPIPVIEIKQMSGRAGRPGFDEYGEAVLIARNHRDEQFLFDTYIKGKPEDIESGLGDESVLRAHVLASVAGLFTRSRQELLDFMKKTFFGYMRRTEQLSSLIKAVLDFLDAEGMVVSREKGLIPTKFGRRISELYIDPLSGVILRDALRSPKEKGTFSLLHMIAHTPDMISLSLRKKDYDEMVDLFYSLVDELLISEEERYPSDEILSELKAVSVLMKWIEEAEEDWIVGHYGIGPGDLRALIELADWLLYAAAEIGKVFGIKEVKKPISLLRVRVSYGVKEELLPLVSLKGIGRVRARNLYNSGFRTMSDIKAATVGDLEKVPSIGKEIAQSIKKQVV